MNIALIPARSGSKGLPDKNIKHLLGKSLIERAIDTASQSVNIDNIYVSTDSKHYLSIVSHTQAKHFGLRPQSLSNDDTKTVDVVLNFLNNFKVLPDNILLLQPSSPIRKGCDIDNCFNILKNENCDSVVSVVKFEEPHPHKLKKINKTNGALESYIPNSSSETPRQSLDDCYALNGAIYLIKTKKLLETKSFFTANTMPYIMKTLHNIDTEFDYLYLNYLIENGYLDNDF